MHGHRPVTMKMHGHSPALGFTFLLSAALWIYSRVQVVHGASSTSRKLCSSSRLFSVLCFLLSFMLLGAQCAVLGVGMNEWTVEQVQVAVVQMERRAGTGPLPLGLQGA